MLRSDIRKAATALVYMIGIFTFLMECGLVEALAIAALDSYCTKLVPFIKENRR